MEQLLTADFWQSQAAVVWSAPWAIVPLLLLVAILVWKIKGWSDDREIRILKADKNAAETRLKLAQEQQQAVTVQSEKLIHESTKMEADVAELKREVIVMKAALPQVDVVVSASAGVTGTARVLGDYNATLGSTLSRASIDAIYGSNVSLSETPKAFDITIPQDKLTPKSE